MRVQAGFAPPGHELQLRGCSYVGMNSFSDLGLGSTTNVISERTPREKFTLFGAILKSVRRIQPRAGKVHQTTNNMAGEVKGYLYSWCGKQLRVQPKYDAVPNGPQRFNYQVDIPINLSWM